MNMPIIEQLEIPDNFADFCAIEYIEDLEYRFQNKKELLSFQDYVSTNRYILLEKWEKIKSPTIH